MLLTRISLKLLTFTGHKLVEDQQTKWTEIVAKTQWHSGKKQRAKNRTDLFNEMSAECLELEAVGVVEVIAEHLSSQEDAHLHHLLQRSGRCGLNSDVIEQLHKQKCAQPNCRRGHSCKASTCVNSLTGLSSASVETAAAFSSSVPLPMS